MKIKHHSLFFSFLLTLSLYGSNPSVYAALGDVIYDNAPKIEKLKTIERFHTLSAEITMYISKTAHLKEQGFALEQNSNSAIDKKNYLKGLRLLSKKNDYFVREAKNAFRESLEQEDSKTFEKIINTGLIDTQKNKQKIIAYYFAHQDEVDPAGVIQGYLDEDAKLRALKEAKRKHYKSKEELEAEKIRRIRENDRRKQEALQKKLEQEVIQKKLEIRQNQKKELFH